MWRINSTANNSSFFKTCLHTYYLHNVSFLKCILLCIFGWNCKKCDTWHLTMWEKWGEGSGTYCLSINLAFWEMQKDFAPAFTPDTYTSLLMSFYTLIYVYGREWERRMYKCFELCIEVTYSASLRLSSVTTALHC